MKHLKKEDGYVLVYVLIVFTILSFVAVSICTMALNNLKAQKADVNRMEARYEAEGYLQQFVAEVEALGNQNPKIQGTRGSVSSAESAMKETFFGAVSGLENNTTLTVLEDESDTEKLTVKVKSKDGTAEIDAAILIDLAYDTTGVGDPLPESEDPVLYNSYQSVLEKVEVTGYHSYEVSYQTADNAEEEVPDEA